MVDLAPVPEAEVPLVYLSLAYGAHIYNYAGAVEDPRLFELAYSGDDGDREPISEATLRKLYEALKLHFS